MLIIQITAITVQTRNVVVNIMVKVMLAHVNHKNQSHHSSDKKNDIASEIKIQGDGICD
jgi:hypothetical protein